MLDKTGDGKRTGKGYLHLGKKNLLFHEELLSAGSVLGGPRPAGPLLQVSKLRFRELCLLSSLNQQVNLNQGFEPGHISKVRTAASQKQTQRPMETTWRSVENGEMTDFPKRSAKHAVPLAATLQCVCVCVCERERERERDCEPFVEGTTKSHATAQL